MTSSTTTTAALAPDLRATGVDFILLTVEDLDRARGFYRDVLGLVEGAVWQRGDAPAIGAEFDAGDATIALMDVRQIGREPRAGGGAIALRVDDVAATQAALEARGVTFQPETIDSGVCHQAYFTDTEGNALILHHRYAPSRR